MADILIYADQEHGKPKKLALQLATAAADLTAGGQVHAAVIGDRASEAAGALGAVVSGADVKVVREALGRGPVLVVPGIRPSGHRSNDHVQVLTPAEALEAGADRLVVGRPVTEAPDPRAAAQAILRECGVG
jgi:orotidine-5'-phosphate decarboxylase